MKPTIVFVCKANLCRSPMAEIIAKNLYPERSFCSRSITPRQHTELPKMEVLETIYNNGLSIPQVINTSTPLDKDDGFVISLHPSLNKKIKERGGNIVDTWEIHDPWEDNNYQKTFEQLLKKIKELKFYD